jgi:beta-N-acetylhexosaminidase
MTRHARRRSWWARPAPRVVAVGGIALMSCCIALSVQPHQHPPAQTTESGHPSPPSASTSATPTLSAADCGEFLAGAMSLDDKVGQLLIVGLPATDPRQGISTVQRYRLGGVFLSGRSTLTPGQLRERLAALQSAAATTGMPQMHVAVDQEGGKVRNLRGKGFTQLPSATVQATWDDHKLAQDTSQLATELHTAGVSITLAPVADVVPTSIGAKNPPIGALGRQYGAAPEDAASKIRIVVEATQQQAVLATLKHFPGLGRVRANTDYSNKAVDTLTTMTDSYLEPFQSGIDAGAAFVMVSSARYPQIDPDNLATFSPTIITNMLRKSMNFDGVIMTDDVGAAAAMSAVPVGDRAVRFVRAGGDLVLTVRLSDAGPMTRALKAEAQQDPGFAALVDKAATRVVTSKVKAGLATCDA